MTEDATSTPDAWLVALRLSPEVEAPEWYSLWFQVEAGDRLLTSEGRLQWAASAEAARTLGQRVLGVSVADEDAACCDVAAVLHDVQHGAHGNESVVLDSVNLLDDMLITVNDRLPAASGKLLDDLCAKLTEGSSLPAAVSDLGGSGSVIEAVLASLGRVFAWSDLGPESPRS